MKRRLRFGRMLTMASLVAAGLVVPAHATPAAGFTGTTIALGRFGEISVFNQLIPPDFWRSRRGADIWLSLQKTKGASDLYVQNNVWQPGGTTGWHSHPGHSLIVVTEGAVTAYEGGDPACQPEVFTTGMGFVDPGGSHVHVLRNEGAIVAKTIAVQLIPADAARRIDVPSPGNCPF